MTYSKKALFLVSLSILVSSLAQSEPTKIQKSMMDEPPSMMDLFLLQENMRIKKAYSSKHEITSLHTTIELTKSDVKNAYINAYPSVNLDWDAGKFSIELSSTISPRRSIKRSYKNAKNICYALLQKLDYHELEPLNALHLGFKRNGYLVEKLSIKELYKKFEDMTHRKVTVVFSGDLQPDARLSCMSDKRFIEIDSVSFIAKGDF
ncbi:MAG: hypothetical protein K6L73_08425 [Cellvibrionaceae bacterium]